MEYTVSPHVISTKSIYICQNFTNITHLKISDPRQSLYYLLTALTSLLSIAGSLILIKLCWKLRNKPPGRGMLVYLSVSDLIVATSNLISAIWATSVTAAFTKESEQEDTVCQIQAGLTSLGSIASFFWTTMIAIHIFLSLIYNNKLLSTRFHILPHLLSWGVPIIVVTITWSSQRYGLNLCTEKIFWCWVAPHVGDTEKQMVQWQLLTGKAWEIASYIIVVMLYSITKFKISTYIRRLSRSQAASSVSNDQSAYQKSTTDTFTAANKKLIFVPLVFIIARIWGTLRFLLDLSNVDDAKDAAAWLAPLQGIGDSAQGFANCMVFLYTTPTLRAKLTCGRGNGQDNESPLTGDRSTSGVDSQAQDYGSIRAVNRSSIGKQNTGKSVSTDSENRNRGEDQHNANAAYCPH